MTQPIPDVIVAGAGIVGLATACELARGGARCVIFDRGLAGHEASFAAGGILSPQAETPPDSPLLPLALKARDRHVALAAELLELTGISVEHRRHGVLSLAFSEEAERSLGSLVKAQKARGLRAELIGREELLKSEGAVHPDARSAALFPDDHRVDNRLLVAALRVLAGTLGVAIREEARVVGVETGAGRFVAARTTNERFEAGCFVNALGAWASQLEGDPNPVPMRPVKGHMLALIGGPALHHVVYGHHGYIVPRTDGRLIVGSTMEEAGFNKSVTKEGLAHLTALAPRIAPATASATIAETWTGLRPATPDGLPVIGTTAIEGMVIAGGLFRNGILLGPLVGEIAARLALNVAIDHDLTPFRPDRFGKS